MAVAFSSESLLHTHDGLSAHAVTDDHVGLVPPGLHVHDGISAHPIEQPHSELHQHDGLPPHPVGSHAPTPNFRSKL